jgi:hypothetical protein
MGPRPRRRPDGPPPKLDSKQKQQIVLAMLRGELSVAEAARRAPRRTRG